MQNSFKFKEEGFHNIHILNFVSELNISDKAFELQS